MSRRLLESCAEIREAGIVQNMSQARQARQHPPRPSPHVGWLLQWQLWYGSAFLVFMWVYHGLSARWVYGILDWEKPLAVVLYLFLPLFTFAGFAAWSGPSPTSRLRYMAEVRHGYSLHPGRCTTFALHCSDVARIPALRRIGVAWGRESLGRRYGHLWGGNAHFATDAESGTAEVEGLTDRDPELELYSSQGAR